MVFLDDKYLLESETAFAIFNAVKDLPVVDPHNHADVAELARDKKYDNPWQVFAATDHYVWEIMRKRGVKEKYITGAADPKEKWLALASIMPEAVGNPVYEWIHLDLKNRFKIDTPLDKKSAEDIWEQVKAALAVPAKRPLSLLKEMNVETMCSTDDPVDMLENHDLVNQQVGRQIVRPTWRPDKSVRIWKKDWREYIEQVGKRFELKIDSLDKLLEAMQKSHDYFAEKGCRASDHDTPRVPAAKASKAEAEAAFNRALSGKPLAQSEIDAYVDYMSVQYAEMDSRKNWVYQMHIGVRRDVRDVLAETIGPDAGGDVSEHMIDFVTPLCSFLNRFDDRLKVVLYCLEPAHTTSLAVVARAFGEKIRLGSAWWLNDTPVGMRRQLEYIGSVDLLFNFAGMVSDSRKILSYASRFEMFRRVLSNTLGHFVELGQMAYSDAERLAERMCYSGPKRFYNL